MVKCKFKPVNRSRQEFKWGKYILKNFSFYNLKKEKLIYSKIITYNERVYFRKSSCFFSFRQKTNYYLSYLSTALSTLVEEWHYIVCYSPFALETHTQELFAQRNVHHCWLSTFWIYWIRKQATCNTEKKFICQVCCRYRRNYCN